MIKVNIINDSGYVQIWNASMRDRRISADARGVLAYMLTHDEEFELSYQTLYDEFRQKKHWVLRVLNELKEFGYLKVTPRKAEKGKFAGWDWKVFGKSQEKDFRQLEKTEKTEEVGKTEKPKVGKTVSRENRPSENPPVNIEKKDSDEERTTEEEYSLNAQSRESWDYPLKELYEAFPDLELTSGQVGAIEADVKDTEIDKSVWLATIKLYRENHNRRINKYLPENVGTLLAVFNDRKKKEERNAATKTGGKQNGNDGGREGGHLKNTGDYQPFAGKSVV